MNVHRWDGGDAFPTSYDNCAGGMSLYDWYAGLAMQGVLANPMTKDAAPAEISAAAHAVAQEMMQRGKEQCSTETNSSG